MVGKNEAGKTAILNALHKFNPFKHEPYSIENEWPRGHRSSRSEAQVVCSVRFELTDKELDELNHITDIPITDRAIQISRDYAGHFEITYSHDVFPDRLHPNDVDKACASMPQPNEQTNEEFRLKSIELLNEVKQASFEGRYSDLQNFKTEHSNILKSHMSQPDLKPYYTNEQNFLNQYAQKLSSIIETLNASPSIQKNAHEYIIAHLPMFIYMSDYRAFQGNAILDQALGRKNNNRLTEEDKTLMTILELAGLTLETEVKKGNIPDREQRQYDLDDASATLTKEISDRWRQRRYKVEFRADGQNFYTFVQNEKDPSLIKLEERSKGFQWFFSFDLMFMYESNATFKNCVILLDEPGLHLHPEAQKDLLVRMNEYAVDNVLIYTTHLPFMIDLKKPESIRIISETDNGTKVTEDLFDSQPEAKFVLQSALGISGSMSYLLAQRNLVVEGVDDYWIISELSRILKNSDMPYIPDDVYITAAGGASEVAYITTLMIGQKLDVIALFDSDQAGDLSKDKLINKWISRYNEHPAKVLMLGDCVGCTNHDFSIEDIFPAEFYLKQVEDFLKIKFEKSELELIKNTKKQMIVKKIEAILNQRELKFNKGSIAKRIRTLLSTISDSKDLPAGTTDKSKLLFEYINKIFPQNIV